MLPPSINSITNNSRYVAESLSGMSNIINYYNRYPLKTIKKEAYQKWVNVYLMMKLKKHLHKEGLIEIRELASLINKKPEFSSSSLLLCSALPMLMLQMKSISTLNLVV